jgi:hypothetical protein
MNLRILKKLSRQAAPLLLSLGDRRDQFEAQPYVNRTTTRKHDRKHWERRRAFYRGSLDKRDVNVRPRQGDGWIQLSEPTRPLAGTPMVGASIVETFAMAPPRTDWFEQTAWESLQRQVRTALSMPDVHGAYRRTRKLSNLRRILAAARELAALA